MVGFQEAPASSERQTLVPESGPVQIGTLAVNPGFRNKAETDALRERFNAASTAWRDALTDAEPSTDVVEASARAFLNATNKVVRVRARAEVRDPIDGTWRFVIDNPWGTD